MFWGDGDAQGRGCTPWAQRFRPEPCLTGTGGFQECGFASGQSHRPGAPRMSEGSPPSDSHWVPRVPLPQLGAQAPDCTGTQPSLHRGSGSRMRAQPHVTGGFRALPTDLQPPAACASNSTSEGARVSLCSGLCINRPSHLCQGPQEPSAPHAHMCESPGGLAKVV